MNLNLQITKAGFRLEADTQLPDTGVTVILGPSGSGKTTLLRVIAGLEKQITGLIEVAGQIWHKDDAVHLPPEQRDIGYVFQDAALFPHLTVNENLFYGFSRIPAAKRIIKPDEVIQRLELEALLARYPQQLSGGQKQRVALGRALLTSPAILLMDEPLASLDISGRQQILNYLESLFADLALPVLYVTHSHAEALRLASTLVYMEQGRVIATGPLNKLATDPDLPLAHLEEASAVLVGNISGQDNEYHLTRLEVDAGCLFVSQNERTLGKTARISIRARDVSLCHQPASDSSIMNVLPVVVRDIHADKDPAHQLVRVEAGRDVLLARLTRKSADRLAVHSGRRMYAQVKSVAIVD